MSAALTTGSPSRKLPSRFVDSLLRASIAAQAALVDARFVRRQGLQATSFSRALLYPSLAWERVQANVRRARQDLLFQRYSRLHPLHYGPSGRGYQSLAGGNQLQRRKRYEAQSSRLQDFLDRYPDLLGFADGHSYLDIGCGAGQNIRMLADQFPHSRIVGYDINPDAIRLIREFETHSGVEVELGDLRDDAFRLGALAGGFDHIVLSHVFSLIFDSALSSTVAMRKRILNDLVFACRGSLVIVDAFGAPGVPAIRIEQRQRGTVTDDVLGYFAGMDQGRAFLVASERTRAVVFVKNGDVPLGGTKP